MSNKIKNLKTLITYLNNQKVEYAVLGKTDTFSQLVDGDIDMVISKKDFTVIENTIEKYCKTNNMRFVQTIQHESVAKYLILADKKDHSIICPDFCYDYVRDTRLLIKSVKLLKNKTSKIIDGFKINILNPEFEFIYYFLKKIDKTKLSNNEFNHLLEQFRLSDIKIIINLLKKYFSKNTIPKIINIFNDNKINGFNKKLILQLRKELHQKKKIKISYFFKGLLLKLKRIFNKTGLSIAIMGSDGCGKSTIINEISKTLEPCFRKVSYYHLKPIESKNEAADVTNPQGQQPYTVLKSIIKLFYLLYQYNVGFVKVYKKLIKSTFVIFDRYYEDLLIDKLRFRYGAPIWMAKVIGIFIPKPKIYILLDASGEVIYNRKQELSIKEINRQRREYRALFQKKKNSYIIDASKSADEVIYTVEDIILKHLEIRQKSRF